MSDSDSADIKRKAGWAIRELDSFYAPVTIDVRAETVYGATIKFFELLNRMIPEDIEKRRLKASFFKAISVGDFKKFQRALRRYDKQKQG